MPDQNPLRPLRNLIRLTKRRFWFPGCIPSEAKQAAEKGLLAGELPKKHAAGAKPSSILLALCRD
jgi:hypothetical protein